MKPDDEEGAIVVEAMIAALIIAGMAAALFATLHSNALAARAADERRRALLVAQSALAAAGAGNPLSPGIEEGMDGDLVWRRAVAPFSVPDGASRAGTVERVTVSVRRAGSESPPLIILPSLRFGR